MKWIDYSTRNQIQMIMESTDSRFSAIIESAAAVGTFFLVIKDGHHVLEVHEHDDLDRAMIKGERRLVQLDNGVSQSAI